MSSRLVAVTFEARDPVGLAGFWGELLGREPVHEAGRVLLPGSDTQIGLAFVAAQPSPATPDRARLHLHLTSTSAEDQQRTVERVMELGGTHLDVGQLPDERHVVVGDPMGNAFCVIEAGNRWLAGCGRLGEVTCDGGPEVGRFWADALDWPLVWDENEETAVQSPLGGTKLSWDGKGTVPKVSRNPHRFELGATDPAVEADRLVSLAATRLADGHDGIELADPDGNEFVVGPG